MDPLACGWDTARFLIFSENVFAPPIELLIFAAGWYLVVVLANRGEEPSFREKVIAAATFIPIFLLAHTSYNLLGYDLTNCDREPIEGPLWQYIYFVEVLFIAWIVAKAVIGYRRLSNQMERKQLALVSSVVVLSLIVFSAGNFLVLFLLDWDGTNEKYNPFGFPILVAFITYAAIRFRTFNLKVITAQELVIAVSILVLSLLFLRTIQTVRIITII